jgi:hypothetical protein
MKPTSVFWAVAGGTLVSFLTWNLIQILTLEWETSETVWLSLGIIVVIVVVAIVVEANWDDRERSSRSA